MQKKKNSLSREQAMELYDDLEKAMGNMLGKKATKPQIAKPAFKPQVSRAYQQSPSSLSSSPDLAALQSMIIKEKSTMNGKSSAIVFLTVLGLLKVATALVDASGVFKVQSAQASLQSGVVATAAISMPKFSPEEKKLLMALDERRAVLEDRAQKIEQKERDLERRDQEFASRLTELREMTSSLKIDREKNDKKKSSQIEQLANVYGSMDPKEAASLIEQLDITISLGLLQKMPEKRIAQILALMSPERALGITRLLSGNEEKAKVQ
jgi:flagellar motility protein MotE (MotC chaperone)